MIDKDIHPVAIEDEMKGSYIDYAMSVIVARALPDARDGLKPVHRRILFGMHELHLGAGKPFKKSARIVGEVMGKYHPHGDSAIYDTLVRMAQDFSLRYPLVDGQGNFGSIDGDSAAAYRYTEARLQRIAEELLSDIDKDTVPFRPNFDESLNEPVVLPSRIPALLVNGTDGIAVGMATKIPPHNLGEVVDAMIRLIDDPDTPTDELLKIIPGPDFPTGGLIVKSGEIARAYKTGRGKLIVRGKTFTEVASNGRTRIIISEIPYQVNKAKLIEDMARLVREKKVEGISDIRDESDRKGMRVVLDLKKDVADEIVVNKLLRYTNLQTTFGVNMVALTDGRPMVMNLKRLCKEFLGHRREVVTRRCRYELRKAEERVHILEGLKIAVDNIDEVIKIIRASKDTEIARAQLMERFALSEIQAKAILDMRLHRLTGLEIDKLVEELEALRIRVQELKEILGDVKRIYAIVKDELVDVKTRYGDGRRTQFILDTGLLDERDLLEDEQKVITLTTGGYVKSMPADTYQSQGRGGKGMKGISLKDEDLVERVFIASTFDYMLFFTNRARCFAVEVWKIPEGSRQAKGKAVVNLLNLGKNETVTAILPIKGFEKDQQLVIATKKGRIKRSRLAAYASSTRTSGIIGFKFAEPDDELVNVRIAQAGDTIVLGTRNGKAIHFKSADVRVCGRVSQGVKGVDLERGDEVVGMEVIKEKATLVVVTENGYGKRTDIEEYRVQSRGGKGIINIKVNPRNGVVAGFREVEDEDEIMVSTAAGKIIRLVASSISKIGRNTQGVRIIDCADGDQVVAVTVIRADEEIAEEGEDDPEARKKDLADGVDGDSDEEVDDEMDDDEDLDDDSDDEMDDDDEDDVTEH